MNLSDAALLQEIRPYELGARLRAARLARGWTQTELAGDLVSVGYVSRLESGTRRPNSQVLEALTQRLGVSVDQLLRGESAPEQDEIRLTLDFAELSLENGDHAEAEVQARQSRDRSRAIFHDELADRATYLVARALEAQGNVDDAILELEPLLQGHGGSDPPRRRRRDPARCGTCHPAGPRRHRPDAVLPHLRRPGAGGRDG